VKFDLKNYVPNVVKLSGNRGYNFCTKMK